MFARLVSPCEVGERCTCESKLGKIRTPLCQDREAYALGLGLPRLSPPPIPARDPLQADPPMETARPQGPRARKTAELIITESIPTGHDRGSRVAFVRITPAKAAGKLPFVATAKIFDSMYYPFETEEFPGHPEDVSYNADREYSREASAPGCSVLRHASRAGWWFCAEVLRLVDIQPRRAWVPGDQTGSPCSVRTDPRNEFVQPAPPVPKGK